MYTAKIIDEMNSVMIRPNMSPLVNVGDFMRRGSTLRFRIDLDNIKPTNKPQMDKDDPKKTIVINSFSSHVPVVRAHPK